MAENKITKQDNGSIVQLGLNDSLLITLPENATTGFQWKFPDTEGLIRVQESFEPAGEGAPGSGGMVLFKLIPLKAFAAKEWVLTYQRLWETEVLPKDKFVFTLTVQ
jgi:inhibitor of cysteine peptidase